jgi:DNA-binding NarL/FixJ family response regulator
MVADGARLLLVEDGEQVRRKIARLLCTRAKAEVIGAGSVKEARLALESRAPLSALIVDPGLPDGSGLDFLTCALVQYPATPALVLSGGADPEAIRRAFDLGADYLVKPAGWSQLERFLAKAASREQRIVVMAQIWAERYALTSSEADILRRAVLGETIEAIARARRSSYSTVKKQVANLRQKTGDEALCDLVGRVLRDACDRSR